MGFSLYEIDNTIARFVDTLLATADEDGTVNDDLYNQLEQLQEERATKLENITLIIKDKEAQASAIKEEESRLADRRKSLENQVNNLKNYLQNSMLSSGESKFETSRCKISFRKSEVVDIADVSKLPEKYIEQVIDYKANKADIKKALKAGEVIEGASLIEKQNIQIK